VQGPDEYPLVREGQAQVLTQIQGGGKAVLAGCQVFEGQVSQGSFVRISRNRRAVWTGRIRQLRLGGASRAAAGQECIIALDEFNDFQPGDSLEAF
jgi:translation initiation factor IF-2